MCKAFECARKKNIKKKFLAQPPCLRELLETKYFRGKFSHSQLQLFIESFQINPKKLKNLTDFFLRETLMKKIIVQQAPALSFNKSSLEKMNQIVFSYFN